MASMVGDFSLARKRVIARRHWQTDGKENLPMNQLVEEGDGTVMRPDSNTLLSRRFIELLERLKEARPLESWSNNALGKKLGMSGNTIGRMRRGDDGFNLDTLDKIAALAGHPAWWLLMTDEERDTYNQMLALWQLVKGAT